VNQCVLQRSACTYCLNLTHFDTMRPWSISLVCAHQPAALLGIVSLTGQPSQLAGNSLQKATQGMEVLYA
jgi:hypothetical protein